MDPRARPKRTYLVADDREREVVPLLDDVAKDFPYEVRRITVGDFAVCRVEGGAPRVLACIERKTLKDFAASLADGRYEKQDAQMRALRAATGCRLFFIIEGPAFPDPRRRFGRIPFSCIQAAITALMVRDGVTIVVTTNEGHTARRLIDILAAFDEYVPDSPGAPGCSAAGGSASEEPRAAGIERLQAAVDQSAAAFAAAADQLAAAVAADYAAPASAIEVPGSLTAPVQHSDSNLASVMWARLRGVSVVLGKSIAALFSVADLVAKRVAPEQIRGLRGPGGRPISKDAVASLLALRAGSADQGARVLTGIPSVSEAIAAAILAAFGGLARVAGASAAELGEVKLEQKGGAIRFGATRAARVLRLLAHVDKRDAGDEKAHEGPPAPKSAAQAVRHPPEPVLLPAPGPTPPLIPDDALDELLAGLGAA